MKTSIIVLAAGLSSRMRAGHKLLLPFGQHTIIEEILTQLQRTNAHEIIIVLGYEQKKIIPLLSRFHQCTIVSHPGYRNGLTSSIQQGVKNISQNSAGFMLCLSDLPFITYKEYQHLLNLFVKKDPTQPCILRTTYKGKYGHPVIFSKHFRDAILQHSDPHGCKKIVRRNRHCLMEIEMDTNAILRDVDTDADYQRIISRRVDDHERNKINP